MGFQVDLDRVVGGLGGLQVVLEIPHQQAHLKVITEVMEAHQMDRLVVGVVHQLMEAQELMETPQRAGQVALVNHHQLAGRL
jgi:hypothetical protein